MRFSIVFICLFNACLLRAENHVPSPSRNGTSNPQNQAKGFLFSEAIFDSSLKAVEMRFSLSERLSKTSSVDQFKKSGFPQEFKDQLKYFGCIDHQTLQLHCSESKAGQKQIPLFEQSPNSNAVSKLLDTVVLLPSPAGGTAFLISSHGYAITNWHVVFSSLNGRPEMKKISEEGVDPKSFPNGIKIGDSLFGEPASEMKNQNGMDRERFSREIYVIATPPHSAQKEKNNPMDDWVIVKIVPKDKLHNKNLPFLSLDSAPMNSQRSRILQPFIFGFPGTIGSFPNGSVVIAETRAMLIPAVVSKFGDKDSNGADMGENVFSPFSGKVSLNFRQTKGSGHFSIP